MALYDSILQYEREETNKVMNKVLKENPLFKTLYTALGGDENIPVGNILSKMVLDEAYRSKDSETSDSHLDNIVNNLCNLHGYQGSEISHLFSIKDWVKAKVEFYQQIIQHDKISYNFEDAIKIQFEDEIFYREAYQPINEAERKMVNEIKKVIPEMSGLINYLLNAISEVREEEIKCLFPKHFNRIV